MTVNRQGIRGTGTRRAKREARVPIPDGLQPAIESFIAGAAQPAVLDAGEDPLPLQPGQWNCSEWNGRLVFEAWTNERNLVRRVLRVKEQRAGRLTLITERFPKKEGETQLADLNAPAGLQLARHALRTAFTERFGLMLAREYPDWRIEDLSAEPNLEDTLSPAYVRAFLKHGTAGIAAMAAPSDAGDIAGIVPFGIIWLDYLRRREKNTQIRRLLLYAPQGQQTDVARRAAQIDPAAVSCMVFEFDERGRSRAVDFEDIGNVHSTLPPCHRPSAPNSAVPDLPAIPDTDVVTQSDGALSLRVRGLEFARCQSGKWTCGIGRRRRCGVESVIALARELADLRSPAGDPQSPLYSMNPEGWLESMVRADPTAVDATLRSAPIYGQVPIYSGPEHGVIDLLAIDNTGQLVVMELKATADPQLPFQAIDYWLRVRAHLEAGDFTRLGYFPGLTVRLEPPRILLIAPSLEFHSTSEKVLGHVSSAISVTRIGLAADWRQGLRVMFRLNGAENPR